MGNTSIMWSNGRLLQLLLITSFYVSGRGLQCHQCYYSDTNGVTDNLDFITDENICKNNPSRAIVTNCDDTMPLEEGEIYRCFTSSWIRNDANGDYRTGISRGCVAVQKSRFGSTRRTSDSDDIQEIFGFRLSSQDTQTGATDFCDLDHCNNGLQCHQCYYSDTNGVTDNLDFITDENICKNNPSRATVTNCDDTMPLEEGEIYRCFTSSWIRNDANGDYRTGISRGCVAVQKSRFGSTSRTSDSDDIQEIFGFRLGSQDTQTGTTDFCDLDHCNNEYLYGIEDICGTRPLYDSRPQTRIFNGRDATVGAWPWIGKTLPVVSTIRHVVLVSEQWALIPAHIPSNRLGPGNTIVFGEVERDGDGGGENSPYRQEVAIRNVYRHPDYAFLEGNDIGLVMLDTPVNFTDYVRPICINQLSNEWEAYENCWITGWGILNDYGDNPQVLQEAPSKVISHERCRKFYTRQQGEFITDSELCGQGGDSNPRVCLTDDGAPLMCQADDSQRWYLMGQISHFLYSCGNNTSVYSRMSNLTSFVEMIIKRVEECSEPDYRCNGDAVCVLEDERCDGEPHCPDGDDEMNCEPEMCADNTCMNGGVCTDTEDGFICECLDKWSGINCDTVNCGETTISISIGSSVNLTSPFYPDEYPSQTVCEWTVTVAESGLKVLVEFLDFGLEDQYDFLYLKETRFTGIDPAVNYTSVTETLPIRFKSDGATVGPGFLLRLSALDVSDIDECEWSPCPNGGKCVDKSDGFSCECTAAWTGRLCDDFSEGYLCGEENITLTPDSTYELTSFNYTGLDPSPYIYKCKWIVTVPEGSQARVKFVDLKTLPHWELLSLDSKVFTGADTPTEDFISEGNRLVIVFNTLTTPISMGFHLIISDYMTPDGNECDSQPCQNGGVCTERIHGFTCKCRRGFRGPICTTVTDKASPCAAGYIRCNGRSGRCIKAISVCDGRKQCPDGSDESQCNCDFHCYNGRCIPQRYVCDSNNNCGDWSDELRPEC